MRTGIVCTALFALAPWAAAEGPNVDTLVFGKTVVGPTFTKQELRGKLLLVEGWGLR